MAVIRVNATRDGVLELSGASGCWRAATAHALRVLPSKTPICILIHGYRFTWRGGRACLDPQERLYGTDRTFTQAVKPERANWAGWLGFDDRSAADGLCIAFGWEARSTASGDGFRTFGRIYRDAAKTGAALARLVRFITEQHSDAEIDIVAHSLGARVALQAMHHEPDLAFGRFILLGAAEFVETAHNALEKSCSPTVYHIMSRANDPFDGLFYHFAPAPEHPGDRSLGYSGLGHRHPRWIDIQLDLPEMRGWLAARGHRLRRDEMVSHWHFYTDPGAMSFYRAILRQRPPYAIGDLLGDGLPDRIEPRWSRLKPRLSSLGRGGGLGPTAAPLPSKG